MILHLFSQDYRAAYAAVLSLSKEANKQDMHSGHNEYFVKHNRVTKKHLGYGRESAGMIGLRR